jgi:hypothetical protein
MPKEIHQDLDRSPVQDGLRVRTRLRGGTSETSCKFMESYCQGIPIDRPKKECLDTFHALCGPAEQAI